MMISRRSFAGSVAVTVLGGTVGWLASGCRGKGPAAAADRSGGKSQEAVETYTLGLHRKLAAQKKRKEDLPHATYSIAGHIIGISTRRTESMTSLEIRLRLWQEPKVEAICDFAGTMLDFVNARRVGDHLALKGVLSNVGDNFVSFSDCSA